MQETTTFYGFLTNQDDTIPCEAFVTTWSCVRGIRVHRPYTVYVAVTETEQLAELKSIFCKDLDATEGDSESVKRVSQIFRDLYHKETATKINKIDLAFISAGLVRPFKPIVTRWSVRKLIIA